MEEILNQTLKYTPNAELIHQQLLSTQVLFENNRLKGINTKQINGLGLRVIKDGKIGFSSTTGQVSTKQDSTRQASTDLTNLTVIENAIISAKFGQEAKFEFPKISTKQASSLTQVKVFDEEVEQFSIEEAIALGKNLIDQLLAIDTELFCKEAEISKTTLKTKIGNTSGVESEYQKTIFTIYLTGLLIRNNSLLWLSEYETGCDLNKDIESMLSKITESLAWSKNELSCKTKKLPVVFTPRLMATILDTVELGVNGKLIQKGASPLTSRLGEKLFDERVTIYDDATIDFAPNSCPVDAEGVRTRKTPLIENGVLKNYLFDLQTAGFLNTVSTGNGHRDFDSLPSPLCSNIVVLPGEMDFYEMIKDMKEGLIIDSVLGGGQSNVLAGEFAFNVELGFKVENGEVVGRLKDTMASCNVFDIFNRLRAIGKESYTWGNVISPHFYFDEISVVGKK
ncbi:MAG: TldD/PmbA family protein [bacterium]|nr:TldD/PmbA family protein [bacterium]